MRKLLNYLIVACYPFNAFGTTPSTTITSDCMEMLRFKNHNEFTFYGNVQIRSKNFYGECGHMWVYTTSNEAKSISFSFWIYGKKIPSFERPHWSYLCDSTPISHTQIHTHKPMGQIKKIIATKHVFLEAQDVDTGEIKRAYSEKAAIFPNEGKMVLTENPIVRSSTQGTFRGEKITFYKHSGRIIVENPDNKQRSQVLLSE